MTTPPFERTAAGLILVATSDRDERFQIHSLVLSYTPQQLADLTRYCRAEAYATDQLDEVTAGFWQWAVRIYSQATEIAHEMALQALFKENGRSVGRIGVDAERIKDKIDIADYIGRSVPLRKSGRHFVGLCPFHDERHGSFVVSPEHGTWHCFGQCDTGGDVIAFVMRRDNADFLTALRELAKEAGVLWEDPQQARPVTHTRQVTHL